MSDKVREVAGRVYFARVREEYGAAVRDEMGGSWGIAYNGCHKIYIVVGHGEMDEAREAGYEIHPANEETLWRLFEGSCFLRFVQRWDLTKNIIPQGACAPEGD